MNCSRSQARSMSLPIPTPAHGWRPLITLTPDRKWVPVIDWTTLEIARVEISTWQRLKPQPLSLNQRKLRAVMRRRVLPLPPTRPSNGARDDY